MWADFDPTDKRTPVAVYPTRADQHGNRPDLQPVRVLVTEVKPAPFKRYNSGDHAEAVKARREAILYLIAKGYSFKAAGYAVGKTSEFARMQYAKACRQVLSLTNIKAVLSPLLKVDLTSKPKA